MSKKSRSTWNDAHWPAIVLACLAMISLGLLYMVAKVEIEMHPMTYQLPIPSAPDVK